LFKDISSISCSNLHLSALQARALDRKRQEARDEAMALLEELEHRQDAPEEGPTAGTSGAEERPTAGGEGLTAGTSGRMAFGAGAATNSGVNRRRGADASDDENGGFEMESDSEGGSPREGETEGARRGPKRKGGLKSGPAGGEGEVELPEEGEGDQIAQVGISGGYRAVTDGPLSVGGGEELAGGGEGGAEESMDRGEGDGAHAHGWLFESGKRVASNGGVLTEEMGSARGPSKKEKKAANGVNIAGLVSIEPDAANGEKGSAATTNGVAAPDANGAENGGLDAAGGVFLEDGEEGSEGEGGAPVGDLLRTELSQAELVRRAFAGDDVEADFEAKKAEMVRSLYGLSICNKRTRDRLSSLCVEREVRA
jgi:U3 small nucleolar RNA-associated protein 14